MADAFTHKDTDVVEKALAKAHPDLPWLVTLLPDGSGLVVELNGARWQVTDPVVKNPDIATAAAEWLLAHQPKGM